MKKMVFEMLVGAFVSLGGVSLVLHLGMKKCPEELKIGLKWLMDKYPVFKTFMIEHIGDLIELADSLEQASKEAVAEEQQQEPPKPS